MIALTFLAILTLFVAVGFLAVRKNKNTVDDYLAAGRDVNPWVVGLAALATGHSGFKFIGLIGFAYSVGLPAIWITIGWMCGDALAWASQVPMRMRKIAGESNILTYAGLLASFQKPKSQMVAVVSGLLTFIFLSSYAAAQFAAGGKSLHVLLGWRYEASIAICATIVAAYCIFGGIRASIWTEVLQSFVMLFGMYSLAAVTVWHNGGFWALFTNLATIDTKLVSLMPQDTLTASAIFLFSLVCSGFGVIGQPHIMAKSMTVNAAKNVSLVSKIYVGVGYTLSFGGLLVGMGARVIIPNQAGFDPETIMPLMAQNYFHPVLAGVLLAALFSATTSTAGSQILACSGAITNDIWPRFAQSIRAIRLSTLVVIALVTTIALSFTRVFDLVMFSWAVLASAFVPLLVLRVYDRPLSSNAGTAMMACGAGAAVLWRLFGLPKLVFDTLPGMACAIAVYSLWRGLSRREEPAPAKELV